MILLTLEIRIRDETLFRKTNPEFTLPHISNLHRGRGSVDFGRYAIILSEVPDEKRVALRGFVPFREHLRYHRRGNSGSPVINKSGQIVGLIFDGNIESLAGRYVYNETDNRAVAVDTAGMTEALRKLYGAQDLVNEIIPGKFPATQ
jgi:hypothetical protein